MLEKEIERYLVNRVKKFGGRAYKFISPGNAGVPDRLVCLPGGRVVLAELKAPGKKPRLLQQSVIAQLRKLGVQVYVIDSREGVDQMLEEVMPE